MLTFRNSGCHEGVLRQHTADVHPLSFLTKCACVLILTAATLLVLPGSCEQCLSAPPKESLSSLQAHPGFKVELVAAEPLIDAPVAFDWAPDGRLWVVEMRDYPVGMDNKGKPGGRIVVLKDQDGDGKYDTSTVFLDNLLFPNGVMSWGKGILITCAPDIIYAEDTDGDGRADKREVLFHGFGEANPQHRVNGLRWGLDNWVYCANGDFAPERDFASYGKQNATDSGFSATQSDDLRPAGRRGSRDSIDQNGQVIQHSQSRFPHSAGRRPVRSSNWSGPVRPRPR